jgi:hypothetical protein
MEMSRDSSERTYAKSTIIIVHSFYYGFVPGSRFANDRLQIVGCPFELILLVL